MKHICCLTRPPAIANQPTPAQKLAFIEAVLRMFIPIVQNKDPRNPVETPSA